MFQRFQGIGRIGKEPELRTTNSGKKLATFSVAFTKKWKRGEEWQEETFWLRCAYWGDYSHSTAERLEKGARVFIEGELSENEYTDRNGVDRKSTTLNVRLVKPLDKRKDPEPQRQASRPAPSAAEFDEDDIPF